MLFLSILLVFSHFSIRVISVGLSTTETLVNCTGFIAPLPPGWISTPMQDQAIHRCLQANPYDTSMIPVLEGGSFHQLSLTFMFSLHSLLELENSGSLVMTASFLFSWTDEYRVLSPQSLVTPVMLVLIPVSEVWVPRFTLAECLCD